MPATIAVVLAIDRLGVGWLGPYGNTWLDTPNFNRLAAQSVLFETALADSPDLNAACRAYWTGQHALERTTAASQSLAGLSAASGARAILVTDDAQIAGHVHAAGFTERRVLPARANATCTEQIEQSGLFAFFNAAREILGELTTPGLLWLHSRGMSGPWDAPLPLRYQFADEEDPTPPELVEPPELRLAEDFDPDALLGFVHAYAGQVALADLCLGMLLDALDEHPLGRETLLVVTSPRGYPLGEHHRVGSCDEALYGELLHVPLLVRFPGSKHGLERSQRIVQPHEIFAFVAEACGWIEQAGERSSAVLRELRGDVREAATLACSVGSQQRSIRTPAWYLRESQAASGPQYELFAKPDDRWEANEVSSRCGDAVELLAAELDRFAASAQAGRLAESAPLAELLCDVWR
jgi:arylsulfatase A-like enzyme